MVFNMPQRLVVPLFQRPYVWNEENQWEPLWNDVIRVAERLLHEPRSRQQPHFLGAVVLQQLQNPTGLMQERTIIDGQQRLTTLQLLLDALHGALLTTGALVPALRIEPLVSNAEPFRAKAEDQFKVWPTNRDRSAFNAVMGAPVPVDYESVGHHGERIVEAHRYFSRQAAEWLRLNGDESIEERAVAIETTVRELLQVVVIDLAVDENAQEIFETLNARGAPLTAADLIKNFVFQRLVEHGADVEKIYDDRWRDFETAFWEAETSVGRLRYPRSSIFLNHWLVAKTGEEVVTREVFTRFKTYADFDSELTMEDLLDRIHRSAQVYRAFIEGASTKVGSVDRLALFGYRTSVLESEVIKPLVLFLLDPEDSPVPEQQLTKALEAVESWMVRRMLVRATTKNYNQVVAELITQLRKGNRSDVGDEIESYLAEQTSSSRYWPDDQEIVNELTTALAYRRLGRGRLRMVLEAIEDHLRGWADGRSGFSERVPRGKLHIEHVLPRKWHAHWPLDESSRGEADRDRLLHTIGNLTLLTARLNTKVSNGPWLGPNGKRAALEAHDVLLLNRDLVRTAGDAWTDAAIRARSQHLAEIITEIWPVPPGHRSPVAHDKPSRSHQIDLADLISAGWLRAGASLHPRKPKFANDTATVLADGRIDIDGRVYNAPSEAARALTGSPTVNGWWFFLVETNPRRSLRQLRRDYLDSLNEEIDEDDDDSDDDA